MPAASPYTRILKFGMPFWKDAQGTLYYFEGPTQPTAETRIPLGTETDGLVSDWKDRLAVKLTTYRQSQAVRPRLVGKAAVAAKSS